MKYLLALILTAFLSHSAFASCGARGFGSTVGVAASDHIGDGYSTAFSTTMSLSSFFWLNGAGGGTGGRIFNEGTTSTSTPFLVATTGTWTFVYGFSTTNGIWTIVAPATGAWHNIVVTYDATATANNPVIYLDGVLVTVTRVTPPIGTASPTTGGITLGNRNNASTFDRNLDGYLADFGYWNAILTASEAKAIGQGASLLNVRPASLQVYTPICGVGTTEPDWGLAHSATGLQGTKPATIAPSNQPDLVLKSPYFPANGSTAAAAIPNVILDDDSGGDVDNLGDRRMFNQLALAGLINPVADITDDSDPFGVSAVKAYQTFQGLSYPLYSYQLNDAQYVSGSFTQGVTTAFNPGDSRSNYTACENGYRTLLGTATSPITIVIGGLATCIDQLLESPANFNSDGFDTGINLIKAHVNKVIWVAGTWPSGTADFNLTGGTFPNVGGYPNVAAATQDLLANWPSTVPFIFYGVDNITTAASGPFPGGVCVTSVSDPYQYGFFLNNPNSGSPCTRFLWTQAALFLAIKGFGLQYAGANGTATFNAGTGANTWTSTAGPFSYVTNLESQSVLQTNVCTFERIGGTNWC